MPRIFPAALFIIVIIYFKPVDSIKCYVCRSDVHEGCDGAPLSEWYLEDCPKRPSAAGSYCRKIQQQLYFKNEEEVTTIRECAYEKNPKQCYKTGWKSTAYQEVCECDKDSCNESSCPTVGLFSLLAIGISLLVST
ncbi:UNVERIFIED_CONTAM: hypothetical protein PYX00_003187 [Menopon gallinae]|uniref:Protein quiver n=1 Tax=Menopon gallinae TaxID=328185 RepID=A0AAW2HZH2_9NEOP